MCPKPLLEWTNRGCPYTQKQATKIPDALIARTRLLTKTNAPVTFFSYCREDSESALRLAEDLKADGDCETPLRLRRVQHIDFRR